MSIVGIVERRTNSIRIGWGSWRIAWVINVDKDIYCPPGWRASFMTPHIVWMTKYPRYRVESWDASKEPRV